MGVYIEDLRAYAQKSRFFLSYIDRFEEKSQKLSKNRDFEHLKVVFETFFQNGQNQIEKRWFLSLCPQYLWIDTPQAYGRTTLNFPF